VHALLDVTLDLLLQQELRLANVAMDVWEGSGFLWFWVEVVVVRVHVLFCVLLISPSR